MVYEALNNMAEVKTGCLVVLNDNEMSIDHNVDTEQIKQSDDPQPESILFYDLSDLLYRFPSH